MYLLDANVVSEPRKIRHGKADRHLAAWAERVDAADLYLSVITLQELEIGVLLAERRDPAQGALLRLWLNQHVLPAFDGRILAVDTALVHGLTVVTRNAADFEVAGLTLLNPWRRA